MIKRISFFLVFVFLLTIPVSAYSPIKRSCDPEKTAAAAARYYPDTLGNCAYYVSKCLRAGGIRYLYEEGCTQLNQILVNRSDVVRFHQKLDDSGYVTVEDSIKAVLAPGDVVTYFCWYCDITQNGPYLHTLIYMGTDKDGKMLAYSHNPWQNPDSAFVYQTTCYEKGCHAQLEDIFFYHFIIKEEYLPREIHFLGIRGNTTKSLCYENNILTCKDSQGRVLVHGYAAERAFSEEMQLCFYQ